MLAFLLTDRVISLPIFNVVGLLQFSFLFLPKRPAWEVAFIFKFVKEF